MTIEDKFNYKGYDNYITVTDIGIPCGYIVIPPNDKLHGVDYMDIVKLAIMGVTFSGYRMIEGHMPRYMLGIDYANNPNISNNGIKNRLESIIDEFIKINNKGDI